MIYSHLMRSMNKLRSYAMIGLSSAAVTAGATVGYDHFASEAATGIEACTAKYIKQPTLLTRCEDNVPFSGGDLRMGILSIIGIVGMGGSLGLALNEARKSQPAGPLDLPC
jgi:hypothetical protein